MSSSPLRAHLHIVVIKNEVLWRQQKKRHLVIGQKFFCGVQSLLRSVLCNRDSFETTLGSNCLIWCFCFKLCMRRFLRVGYSTSWGLLCVSYALLTGYVVSHYLTTKKGRAYNMEYYL